MTECGGLKIGKKCESKTELCVVMEMRCDWHCLQLDYIRILPIIDGLRMLTGSLFLLHPVPSFIGSANPVFQEEPCVMGLPH